MDEVKRLALDISSCDEVSRALKDESHPCHAVVKWQSDQWEPPILQIQNSSMHRPEAWTGDLTVAPMIFLSSNPSFNKKENFPNWNQNDWNPEEVIDFSVNRFSMEQTRKYGATESSIVIEKDRTIGFKGELSERVSHWRWVRQFASLVYDKDIADTSAISDYVMTEFVHCKSPHEEGVISALGKCKSMWLDRILSISPARLIFITGVKSGSDFANLYESDVPSTWGSWTDPQSSKGKGVWPRTEEHLAELTLKGQWTLEHQLKNTIELKVAGVMRHIVYIARPGGGGGLNTPWNHPDLVHPDLIKHWRSVAGIHQ
jgi:hypothetical protein